MLLEILSRDQPFDDVELKAAGAGHIVHYWVVGPRERDRNRFFSCACRCQMDMGLPSAPSISCRRVVAPPRDHRDAARFLWDKETQAHRRWKVPLLGGLARRTITSSSAFLPRTLTPRVKR